jgi:hypothetical protein
MISQTITDSSLDQRISLHSIIFSRPSFRFSLFITLYFSLYRLLYHHLSVLFPSLIFRYFPRARYDTVPTSSSSETYSPSLPRSLSISKTLSGSVTPLHQTPSTRFRDLPSSRTPTSKSTWQTYRPSIRSMTLKCFLSPYGSSLISALLTSPTFLLLPSETKIQRSFKTDIALFTFCQAVISLFKSLDSGGYVPSFLNQESPFWGRHILWGLCQGQLLYNYIFNPESISITYRTVFEKFSSAYLPSRPSWYPSSEGPLFPAWPSTSTITSALAAAAGKKPTYPSYQSPLLGHQVPTSLNETYRSVEPIVNYLTHPNHSRLTCAILHPQDPSCYSVGKRLLIDEGTRIWGILGLLELFTRLIDWKNTSKE